jgi:hypothetical protein
MLLDSCPSSVVSSSACGHLSLLSVLLACQGNPSYRVIKVVTVLTVVRTMKAINSSKSLFSS